MLNLLNFQDSDVTPLMLAAVSYQEKNYDEAVSILEQALKKDAENLRIRLTLAQMRINRNEDQEAATLLRSSSVRHEPAIVALLVKLTDDVSVLNESVEYWKQKYQKDKVFENSQEANVFVERQTSKREFNCYQ
jgi:predicted negative regulator of RcsB-dependent stress response